MSLTKFAKVFFVFRRKELFIEKHDAEVENFVSNFPFLEGAA